MESATAGLANSTKTQRCWVHKTANVFNKLPKKLQSQREVGTVGSLSSGHQNRCESAFNRFLKTYQVKYPEASECLEKDRDVLLAFYDFRRSTGKHIRSSNPIESTFATVRLRTKQTRGALSKRPLRRLCSAHSKRSETVARIRGFKHLGDVIEGVQFRDGLKLVANEKVIADQEEQKVA